MSKGQRPPYTDAELALFVEYEPVRAEVRPAACTGGERCWVKRGPPGTRPHTGRGHVSSCIECGGAIVPIGGQRRNGKGAYRRPGYPKDRPA